MWVSGPRLVCSNCGASDLCFVGERFDAVDGIYVGTVRCRACASSLLYSRTAKQMLPQYDPTEPQQTALPWEATQVRQP